MPDPKEFIEYAKTYYTPAHPEKSLKPTIENIKKAWSVYEAGVLNETRMRPAIEAVYGYWYRRMAYFLEEIQAYKPGLGWVAKRYICRASWSLVSPGKGKKKRVDFELTLELTVPLGWRAKDALELTQIDNKLAGTLLEYAWLEASSEMEIKCSFDGYTHTFFPATQKWYLIITIGDREYSFEGEYTWSPREEPEFYTKYA